MPGQQRIPDPPLDIPEFLRVPVDKPDPTPQFRVVQGYYHIRIYCGDILHLHINKADLLGMQAWRDSPVNYSIEYILRGGSIVCEYDTAEKWQTILAGLEKIL